MVDDFECIGFVCKICKFTTKKCRINFRHFSGFFFPAAAAVAEFFYLNLVSNDAIERVNTA